MAIKKFKVEVTRTDEYLVEIDEEIYNKKWRMEFAEVFWPLESTADIAQDLAANQMIHGQKFWEGYGYVKEKGKLWFPHHDKKPTEGLNIERISSEDYDFDVEEVHQSEIDT